MDSDLDREFLPLPYYPFDQRPDTLPLDADEAATAIHLSRGDLDAAAALLKTPTHVLNRLVKRSPRLQAVLAESFELTLIKAASIPIRTLFDPDADARRLEWASSKVLSSRLASGHPLSPAPAGSSTSMTVNQDNREITIHWGPAPTVDEKIE
jgi:hypothetical protein